MEWIKDAINLPWYVYLITFFIIMLFIGKKKEWEYQAKFFKRDSREIQGELKIKKFKGFSPQAVIELNQHFSFWGKTLTISINNNKISEIEYNKNKKNYHLHYPQKLMDQYIPSSYIKWHRYPLEINRHIKISNNDQLEIFIDGQLSYQGLFYKN